MKQKQASASLVRHRCWAGVREREGRKAAEGGRGNKQPQPNRLALLALLSHGTGGSSRAAVGRCRRARPARAWRPQYLGGTESVTRLASSTPVLLTGLPCLSSLLVASMSQIMTKSLCRSAARHVAKHTTCVRDTCAKARATRSTRGVQRRAAQRRAAPRVPVCTGRGPSPGRAAAPARPSLCAAAGPCSCEHRAMLTTPSSRPPEPTHYPPARRGGCCAAKHSANPATQLPQSLPE